MTAKDQARSRIGAAADQLLELSHRIHAHPETAWTEHRAAGWADTDLRVDWHDDPIGELGRLWALWQPQRQDYITRGLHPASAPAYGVPGDR